MIDAWLLERFPGRTLDELDGMDWGRYMRALEAKNIADVESQRELFANKKIKREDITAEEWAAIQEHDEMMGANG